MMTPRNATTSTIAAMIDAITPRPAGRPAKPEREAALETARASGHLLLEAELLEVLAGAARKRADGTAAGELERQAAELFGKLHAPVWGKHFRETVRKLSA